MPLTASLERLRVAMVPSMWGEVRARVERESALPTLELLAPQGGGIAPGPRGWLVRLERDEAGELTRVRCAFTRTLRRQRGVYGGLAEGLGRLARVASLVVELPTRVRKQAPDRAALDAVVERLQPAQVELPPR